MCISGGSKCQNRHTDDSNMHQGTEVKYMSGVIRRNFAQVHRLLLLPPTNRRGCSRCAELKVTEKHVPNWSWGENPELRSASCPANGSAIQASQQAWCERLALGGWWRRSSQSLLLGGGEMGQILLFLSAVVKTRLLGNPGDTFA